MSAFKPQQRHLAIGGRTFHFVSYEGQPPNPRRGEAGGPPMWYLMVEGRRCPAMPCDPAQALPDVDRALARWAEAHALVPTEPVPPSNARRQTRTQWWGPN